jgi:tetratricopeptide (TPR) repeat protein
VRVPAAAALGLLLTACATFGPSRPAPDAAHQRARALEADGQLRAALLEWKVARTIDPEDAAARASEARLAGRIEGLVAQKVNEARAALQRGAPLQARRLLLGALALDPNNATAAILLRERVGDLEFVSHTVRAGETLSSLAERYYGDRARGEVIWEHNSLAPGRPLAAGAVLRIPEIPGLPFYTSGRKPPPPPPTTTVSLPVRPPERPAVRGDEPPEVNPLLADVREAAERREFVTALADLDRYLASNPKDRDGIDLKKQLLYRQGQSALDEKKFEDSYRALAMLAKLQPDYQDVAKLLPQARRHVVDRHYQEGIKLFREEKLQEAIAEWRVVLDVEPQHTNARRNIEQAERLLKGLEQKKTR